MEDKILAGIILFDSDFERLKKCLEALYRQVSKIVLYDNSIVAMDDEKIKTLFQSFGIEYIKSKKNEGMPGALNIIIEVAKKEGFDWVLTMNPDTIVPKDMIEKFKPYFTQKDIAIVCPQVIDKRRKYMEERHNNSIEYVDVCITSAACTRIDALTQVGGFDSWLFVDLLDNDLSKRLILTGWKILKVNDVVIDQEFGEIELKEKWKVDFWLKISKSLNNVNFAKLSYRKKVSYLRVYYTCRNVLYLEKKFKNYGGMDYEFNYNCHSFFGFVICFILPNILQAESKARAIKHVWNGIKDGKNCLVQPWRHELHYLKKDL